MKCPFCGSMDNKVIDSRVSSNGEVTRRRRECDACERRYTTYERVEDVLPMVVKRDGRRELFDRQKLVHGVRSACSKRPVSSDQIDSLAERVEREFQEGADREVSCAAIGEIVMRELRQLDQVAYVRFASVYRQFRDLEDFSRELETLVTERTSK